jgi:dihydroorotate dehydrogenase electron transfer subunit
VAIGLRDDIEQVRHWSAGSGRPSVRLPRTRVEVRVTGIRSGEMPTSQRAESGRLVPLALTESAAQTNGGDPSVCEAEIVTHRPAGDRYWLLELRAPRIAAGARPGQFVMLTVARGPGIGPVLPRPMAIFRSDDERGLISIVYGVVGLGTRHLTAYGVGERITVLGPLGRGFHLAPSSDRVLLVGRGIGTCSLTALAAEAVSRGVDVVAVDSARTPAALIGGGEYRRAGVATVVRVTDSGRTSDPAALRARLVRELAEAPPAQVFACGSERLTRMCCELAVQWGAEAQVSIEARMACGLGYCHGCSTGHRTAGAEAPLVCTDGPVFRWLPWDHDDVQ